jgi:hypothetical protein
VEEGSLVADLILPDREELVVEVMGKSQASRVMLVPRIVEAEAAEVAQVVQAAPAAPAW